MRGKQLFAKIIWGTPLVIYSALAQGLITPDINRQFTDNSGLVIASGRVYTCIATTSCPGNPTPTYTTSSLSTAHTNPIVLDSAGRPPGGQIWLVSGVSYKFVVTNSVGTIIAGAGGDNIVGGSGSGGGGSSQWTTLSSNIYNANAGNVGIGLTAPGEKLDVVGNSRVKGTFYLQNSDSTPRTIGLSAPLGMSGNLAYTLPSAYPTSSGYVLSSTTGGVMSWVANGGGGGGGGSGAANPYATSAPAVTSLAIDITALNLTSINPALIQCWSGTTTRSPLAITNFTTTGTSPITTVTPTFSSTANVTCQVNSNGGDSTLWSLSSNEVTLASGSYRIPNITFEDLTASTGVTSVVFKAGPGQLTTPTTTWLNNAGTTVAAVDKDGNSIWTSVVDSGALTVGGTTTLSTLVSGVLKVNGSGVVGLVSGSGSDCVKVDGTSGTCGGGGASLPVSDATSIVEGSTDATKELRFEVDGFTTASVRVLTPQDSSYTIAGTNITQTFSANQTFGANLLFSANDTYDIGTDANRARSGYFRTDVQSPIFRAQRISAGSVVDYFDLRASPSSNGIFEIRDSSSNSILQYQATPSVKWISRGGVEPTTNNTYALGASSFRWSTGYFTDLNVSGTCTGCTGGANTALSNLSSVAFNTNLLPGSDDLYTTGSSTFRLAESVARQFRSCYNSAGSCETWKTVVSGSDITSGFYTSGGIPRFLVGTVSGRSWATLVGDLLPGTDDAWDIGSASLSWRTLYLKDNAGLSISATGQIGSLGTYSSGAIGFFANDHASGYGVLGDSPNIPFRAQNFTNKLFYQVYNGSATAGWYFGSGSPEGSVTANVGSLYSRSDGGSGSTLYVKESGTGNTGWAAK